jgi:transcription elongation factor GreA
MGKTYLTKEGLQKLQDEMKHLQRQRLDLTEEVNKAAQMGDLRENAEYHAARERLQHVSTRLLELNSKLHDVQIIDDLPVSDGEARIGMLVTLQDIKTKEEFAYHLVGPDEADPAKGKLSIASPLGKTMLGKKPGEQFNLNLPRAIVPYRVVKIERPS